MVLMKNESGIQRGGVTPSSCGDGVGRPSQHSSPVHISTQPYGGARFQIPTLQALRTTTHNSDAVGGASVSQSG